MDSKKTEALVRLKDQLGYIRMLDYYDYDEVSDAYNAPAPHVHSDRLRSEKFKELCRSEVLNSILEDLRCVISGEYALHAQPKSDRRCCIWFTTIAELKAACRIYKRLLNLSTGLASQETERIVMHHGDTDPFENITFIGTTRCDASVTARMIEKLAEYYLSPDRRGRVPVIHETDGWKAWVQYKREYMQPLGIRA